MATREIKTTLTLDGEREYKQAVSEISKGLSVLDSELKLVDERFKKNADSVEALTERGTVLEKTLDQQRKKMETLQKAYEESAERLGENARQTQEWQIKLNNAQRAILKTEDALEDNAKALQEAKERTQDLSGAQEKATRSTKSFGDAQDSASRGTVSFGDAVGGLADKLGINIPDGAKEALGSMGSLSSGFVGVAGAAAAVAAAVAKVVKALVELTAAQAEAAREIQTNSRIMGMTAEEYQEWDFVLKTVGYSAEEAQGDLSQLAEKAMDAAAGAGEGAELFGKLGVSVQNADGTLKSQNQILNEVILSLRQMTDETERNAIASALLSTTGERLVPILEKSAEEVEALKTQAHELGVVMSEETLQTLEKVNESMTVFNASTEGAKNLLAEELAPSVSDLMETLTELTTKLAEFAEDTGLAETLEILIDLVSNLLDALGPLLDILNPIVSNVLQPISQALGLVADAVKLVVGVIEGLVSAMKDLLGISEQMDFGWLEDIVGVFNGGSSFMKAWNIGRNAGGTNNWRGGLTWVGENGPELVSLPRGSSIFSNSDSARMMGGNTYNITIDVKSVRELNDIVRIAENRRASIRAGIAR